MVDKINCFWTHGLARAKAMNALVREHANELPPWRQWSEIALLRWLRGMPPVFYFLARWWRRGIPMSVKFKCPNPDEYRRFIERHNPEADRGELSNKYIQKKRLAALGVSTPELFGYFHPLHGECAGIPLTDEASLTTFLQSQFGRKLAIKLAGANSGVGFKAGVLWPHGLVSPNGKTTPIRELIEWVLKSKDGVIFEKFLEQHPVLASLNSSSVNTVRALVLRTSKGANIIGAYLRVGTEGSLVDNTSAGGMVCSICPTSGQLGPFTSGKRDRRIISSPQAGEGSGAILILPYWDRAKELAVRAMDVIPEVGYAGLDLAIGFDGPYILELNVKEPYYLGLAYCDLSDWSHFQSDPGPLKKFSPELETNTFAKQA